MADQVYRVAVIGRTGHGDYGHAVDTGFLDHPRTEVVAVCDDNPAGLAKASERLKTDKTYADYRKMLDETKPDIVAICQRWIDRHQEMAVEAHQRGMHVYMEKPFCRSLAEADQIIDAGERTHTKLAVAHPTRYSPKIDTIKKLFEQGKLGQVLEYRGRGKEDRRGGGEDLWVLGSHVMDMIRAIGGHPVRCQAVVLKEGEPVTASDIYEGNEGIGPLAGDELHAVYEMPDGSFAYFDSVRNMAGRPSRYGLQVYGSRGALELLEGTLPPLLYLGDPSWSPGRSGASWEPVSSAGIGQPEPLTDPKYKHRHWLAIDDLLESIEVNRQPLCSAYEARGATEMIAAVFESHRQGQPVELPLKTRENPLALLKG